MMWRCAVFIAVSFVKILCHQNQDDPLVDYYLNLIQENTRNVETYELPSRNEEFRLADSDSSTNPIDVGTFDFVIVGAGSAGAVLATRLSEITDWNILLLEAGGEETDFSDIPKYFGATWFSEMNWGYYTTPQNASCQGMKDNICVFFRGKVIGGCSTINALMYVRGTRADYDKWAHMGNAGWSYDEVLPYFIKSEHALFGDGDPGYHGTAGPWDVRYSWPDPGTYQNFVSANSERGLRNIDYNGKNIFGFRKTQMSIQKSGKRASTGRAFLDKARDRKNLQVVTKALATKILMSEDNLAQGVEFIHKDQKYVVRAQKEVLVSAGAVNSPQLLMLSGLGPKNHLESLRIPVVKNLPAVGSNLQDHLSYPSLVFHTNYTVQNNDLVQQIKQFLQGYGPLASTNNEAITFILPNADDTAVPDIEYIFLPANSTPPASQRSYNLKDEVMEQYYSQINTMTDIKFMPFLLHPKSKGRITLKSSNPLDFPDIDPNYYSDPKDEDIEKMYQGILAILKLTDTEAFRKINTTFIDYGEICLEHQKYSRQYWYCALRHFSSTIFHPVCTTRMGLNPMTSVVDKDLKVHGIGKLRVVDAGVLPAPISGHTNAPVVMIAEKISDQIKTEYLRSVLRE